MSLSDWVAQKRRDIDDADPRLTLRHNLARVAARAERAEAQLRLVRMLHTADEFGTGCLGCRRPWPCATFRLLDPVADCPSRDPWTGALCAKAAGHRDLHGGIDSSGAWRTWS